MKYGTGLTQAFRTLTVLPTPGKDARKVSSQLFFYPFVGLVVGAIGSLILYGCTKLFTISTISSLVLGVLWACWMAFATRGFHLDGLGDTADGFGGGWTRERRLEIMKDSRTGSFGVIAICLCLVLKSVCAASAVSSGKLSALLWSAIVSRMCVVLMCSACSYAKESGLSYDLVKGAGFAHSAIALLQSAAYGAALYFLLQGITGWVISPVTLVAMTASALVCTLVPALVSARKIGGITGDVLGACCEISEAAALLAAVFSV